MDVVSYDTCRLSYDMCHLAHYGTLLQNIIITDYYSFITKYFGTKHSQAL